MNADKEIIKDLVKIAESASNEILKVYKKKRIKIKNKIDNSPFTEADLKSEKIILSGLKKISNYPIISEETYKEQKKGKIKSYWLVDPLDGTKDFLAKNDEFTINIAFINNHSPILGLIYIPAKKNYYWAIKGSGSYKGKKRIYARSRRTKIIGVISRFHCTKRDQLFFKKNNIKKIINVGAAIKFCKIAEGQIDVYPRYNGSSEWDVAAGHIIIKEAGCKIISLKTKKELSYKKRGIKNDYFVVSRNDLNFL